MIGNRKDDHVRHAVDQQREGHDSNDFESVAFLHHACAGIDYADVALSLEITGKPWAAPLFINGMTGGSERTGQINRELAIAARETGLPIASGSMSAYFADDTVADSYRVLRGENPRGFVMANVNANATVEQVRRAVALLEADAVQIHLNAVQEIVMPEGDRSFAGWPRQIERITQAVEVPVVVKEVGFGLSRRTVRWLREAGVAAADVGGRGGTNFARIENNRRTGADFSFAQGWGQSTVCCLLDVSDLTGIEILASGGVRSPLDVARALALGAKATGVAGHFLRILVDQGTDALVTTIENWLEQLRQLMTVLGARTPDELLRCDLLLTGDVESFCRLRGIDPMAYSFRSPDSSVRRHS
ncbi:type 2 isopentenyl-diphosphate Delta-isomerase [Nocardia sp. NBC_01503]|uniref:type 2 isopentenyl-diphosphate Delta-isomerase n=1 Tax=Nocardia sp. NBC_01503 TaxID=2975997 RepID=UPI002E7AFF17|nr:type 2 isopentenyl-diphosphate Delta-isomerase [Nocardia sp. NBC_01503]WTL29537.1 type 2 isopentenyl-diphosphate Delta-isomerase [Nocardia sp. NBC_01503]